MASLEEEYIEAIHIKGIRLGSRYIILEHVEGLLKNGVTWEVITNATGIGPWDYKRILESEIAKDVPDFTEYLWIRSKKSGS